MSGENCCMYRRDARCAGMPRGCISCLHCDGFGRCRADDDRTSDAGNLGVRMDAARDLSTSEDVAANR